MRVGLLGPASTAELADLLDGPVEGLPSGMGGYPVTLLARNLVLAGHQVHLYTLDAAASDLLTVSGPNLAITYVPYRTGHRGRDLYADERRWLVRALDGCDADVLNPHWSYEYAHAAMTRPEPLVLTVHDWAPTVLRYQTDPYRLARLAMFLRTHVRRPAMTTPSPYLRRYLRWTGLGTATVVPNGVPLDRFVGEPRVRGDGEHLVGVAMGFGNRKNTQTLMRAVAQMRAAGRPTTLTIYGTEHGPGEEAQTWARAEGVAEGVTFAGLVPYDTVLDALGSCDLFVHPAREESFGMVLIEAMARGTPVVAGQRSGAVPWVMDFGRSGILTDIDSPDAIAAAVGRLLDDPREWGRRSAVGLASTRARFGMDVVTDGYLGAYEQVLGRR